MGIPKFYRYISERWPTISNLVNGNVIPEFDNLYLDMNAIIHNCTHSNDGDVTHRMSEQEMMVAIFNYIDHLFSTIKPRKVFYMAIDGVAPRAKMNQQRSRRFKSAKEAEQLRRDAINKGVELPAEEPFDSNCITPGTEFMANLTVNLKYFINRKITEDASWRDLQVVLSGHEVPGEGEHKIMNFLRSLRSEPNYDQNTRHCLYGLDADLIMLGLSTHEPHFALLREEVVFGRQAASQSNELSEKRFFLLHLSLVREYMQLEFDNVLSSTSRADDAPVYDFERILDDFILINFFVGNDFLPEIPMLLISDGALPVIFKTYMDYLLEVNDYLTKDGIVNFGNLRVWLEALSVHQTAKFEEQAKDAEWFNNELDNANEDVLVLTQHQKDLIKSVKAFILGCALVENLDDVAHVLPPALTTNDISVLGLLAHQTQMRLLEAEQDDGSTRCELVVDTKQFPVDEAGKHKWLKQARATFKTYEKAKLTDEKARQRELYSQKLVKWRDSYYRKKFGVPQQDPKVRATAVNYLEGLQWVLSYYYRGCPSWGWYFADHYAPMTSDLYEAITDDFEVKFGPSTPFKPFEQLMGVLPDRSKQLVPPAYRDLMTDPASPIIDFYPHDFETDRNGKKMEWESVVLIPFIDEVRLQEALAKREGMLSPSEKQRNGRGQDIVFSYDANASSTYRSGEDLPEIVGCKCVETVANPHAMDASKIVYGILPNAKTGVDILAGFPTLETLDYTFNIEPAHVRVFEMESRKDSIVLTIKQPEFDLAVLAPRLLESSVYINYPFLSEAKVVAVSDAEQIYKGGKPQKLTADLSRDAEAIHREYARSKAINYQPSGVLVHVQRLIGLSKSREGNYRKEFSPETLVFPMELVVENVLEEDERFRERKALPVEQEFPVGSKAIVLLNKLYGCEATIAGHNAGKLNIDVVAVHEPSTEVPSQIARHELQNVPWYNASAAGRALRISPLLFSQITSRYLFTFGANKFDLGIVLKKAKDNLKVQGYAQKAAHGGWVFSDAAVRLVGSYLQRFGPLVLKLAALNSKSGVLDIKKTELGTDETFKQLQEIKAWIRDATQHLRFVDLGTQRLLPEGIAAVEFWARNIAEPASRKAPVRVENVHRGALMTADMAHHQLRKQNFALGKRVMYALDHGKVAQFERGIVVGVKKSGATATSVEVVFDHEFEAGSSLDGEVKTKRGLTLDSGCLLECGFKQLAYDRTSADTFESAISIPGRHRSASSKKSNLQPAAAPKASAWKGESLVPVRADAKEAKVKEPKVKEAKESKAKESKAKESKAKPNAKEAKEANGEPKSKLKAKVPKPQAKGKGKAKSPAPADAQGQAILDMIKPATTKPKQKGVIPVPQAPQATQGQEPISELAQLQKAMNLQPQSQPQSQPAQPQAPVQPQAPTPVHQAGHPHPAPSYLPNFPQLPTFVPHQNANSQDASSLLQMLKK